MEGIMNKKALKIFTCCCTTALLLGNMPTVKAAGSNASDSGYTFAYEDQNQTSNYAPSLYQNLGVNGNSSDEESPKNDKERQDYIDGGNLKNQHELDAQNRATARKAKNAYIAAEEKKYKVINKR